MPDRWPIGPNNNISIDSETGTLSWDSPKEQGEYNVAILIEEWRRVGNSILRVGSVLRDLQITVADCESNNPPVIDPINDTCVTATEVLLKNIRAVDNDSPATTGPQSVTLQAEGDPFFVVNSKAVFADKTELEIVNQEFRWQTQCSHIRHYPYFVVFRANDNAPLIPLSDYLDWRINVYAPAPTNLNTVPVGSGVDVSWDYTTCTNAIGYRIYRSIDSAGYVATNCVTGVPADIGYTLVGDVTGNVNTQFF